MFNTISTVRIRGKWGMFRKTNAQVAVSMKCKKAGCTLSPYSTHCYLKDERSVPVYLKK